MKKVVIFSGEERRLLILLK